MKGYGPSDQNMIPPLEDASKEVKVISSDEGNLSPKTEFSIDFEYS